MSLFGNGNGNGRSSIWTRVIIPVILFLFVIIGVVWGANRFVSDLTGRIDVLETFKNNSSTHDSRINQIEYRLNWIDEEKNRDRLTRQQLDRDIRDAIDSLNKMVNRMEGMLERGIRKR